MIASQIVLGLQTIQSRQVDVTSDPSVLTVGIFNAGNRTNIIPDKAELEGTLRTLQSGNARFHQAAGEGDGGSDCALSGGGEAVVGMTCDYVIPLINNVSLTKRMLPTSPARRRRR